MIRIVLIYCLGLILASCGHPNLLNYKRRKYYEENSIIKKDSIFELYQYVLYNRLGIIDEEFCYNLTLTFLDTAAAKTKRILNLATDTLIVKSSYGRFSVWNWSDEHNIVTGQIEIVTWDKDGITLKENIIVLDYRRKETKTYKGTRTYNRKEGW